MNRTDSGSRPIFRLPGKELIIFLVVVSSSLSFTLGFFVGRKTGSPVTDQPVHSAFQSDIQSSSLPPMASVENGQVNPDKASSSEPAQAKEATAAQSVTASNDQAKNQSAAVEKTPEKGKGVAASGGQTAEKTPVYTVQLSAFKSKKEAEKTKAILDGKGYNTFITTASDNGNERIYKVRSGNFSQRKDAEILSLKIRKAEGLNTFVTLRDE